MSSPGIPTPSAPTASGGAAKPTTAAGTKPTSKTTAAGTTPEKPNYDSTSITHHYDGSHTVSHNSDEPGKSVSYAKSDLGGVLQGLDEHLG